MGNEWTIIGLLISANQIIIIAFILYEYFY